MTTLYVSVIGEANWYAVGPESCAYCEEPLMTAIASVKWERHKNAEFLLFCPHCIEKRYEMPYNHYARPNALFCLLPVRIVPERPKNTRVWIPAPPDFTPGRISTLDAANPSFDKRLSSDADAYQIEDNTVYAGRESFEGAQIGSVNRHLLLEKDKTISPKEAEELLQQLKDSDKKLLGDDSE